jgi:hypothetical protein
LEISQSREKDRKDQKMTSQTFYTSSKIQGILSSQDHLLVVTKITQREVASIHKYGSRSWKTSFEKLVWE